MRIRSSRSWRLPLLVQELMQGCGSATLASSRWETCLQRIKESLCSLSDLTLNKYLAVEFFSSLDRTQGDQ